jgi:hypothetical protein
MSTIALMYHCALRLAIPDEPGALGNVASRIGIAGGDVLGMDVLERKADRVVDELVIALKRPADAEVLRREVSSVGGVTIHEIRPVSEDAHESGLATLEHLVGLLEMPDRDAFVAAALEDLVCRTHSDGGAVVERDGSQLAAAGDEVDLESHDPTDTRCCVELRSIGASLVLQRRDSKYRDRERRRVTVAAALIDARLRGLLA